MKVASTEQAYTGQLAVDQGLPHSVKYQTLSSIEGESYLMIVYTREELRLASHSLFSDWTGAGEKGLVTLGQRRYDNITCMDCGMSINVHRDAVVGVAVYCADHTHLPFAAVD